MLDGQEGSYYTDFTNMVVDNDEISGDKINGGIIGSITISQLAGAMDCNNQTMTDVDIDSGAIDGTPVGANTPSSGAFTTLTASGNTTIQGRTIIDVNNSEALVVRKDGTGQELLRVRTDDGSELVKIDGNLQVTGAITGSSDENTSLTFKGGLVFEKENISSTTTLTANDHLRVITGASASVQVTLPAASSHSGREYILIMEEGSQEVTIAATGSDNVYTPSGGDLIGALDNNRAYRLVSSGTHWYQV